jgi:hypothetical protein
MTQWFSTAIPIKERYVESGAKRLPFWIQK